MIMENQLVDVDFVLGFDVSIFQQSTLIGFASSKTAWWEAFSSSCLVMKDEVT